MSPIYIIKYTVNLSSLVFYFVGSKFFVSFSPSLFLSRSVCAASGMQEKRPIKKTKKKLITRDQSNFETKAGAPLPTNDKPPPHPLLVHSTLPAEHEARIGCTPRTNPPERPPGRHLIRSRIALLFSNKLPSQGLRALLSIALLLGSPPNPAQQPLGLRSRAGRLDFGLLNLCRANPFPQSRCIFSGANFVSRMSARILTADAPGSADFRPRRRSLSKQKIAPHPPFISHLSFTTPCGDKRLWKITFTRNQKSFHTHGTTK